MFKYKLQKNELKNCIDKAFHKNMVELLDAGKNTTKDGPESLFLAWLGTSSFLARHELYEETTENLLPSWVRSRSQPD